MRGVSLEVMHRRRVWAKSVARAGNIIFAIDLPETEDAASTRRMVFPKAIMVKEDVAG